MICVKHGIIALLVFSGSAYSLRTFAAAVQDSADRPYADLIGKVVLDNERVIARSFTLPPGQATGVHTHHDAELVVFVKGGVLESESTKRAVLWRDGRVVWLDPSPVADDSKRNVGRTTVKFIEVVLKSASSMPRDGKRLYEHLNYPNLPTEDLLENDRVIVQRFRMNPGEWEGIHAHPANTLYIFIKGGTGGHWVSTTTNPPSRVVGFSPDGDVGWMQPVDIHAGHQSGNIGTSPSDVVWIALKDM